MVVRKAVRLPVPPDQLPEFTPVPRKRPRHDGWTPERQRAFVAALADTGCVAIAARMVNMSQASVYQLRRQPGAESFRIAMDAAQSLGLQPVRDEAFHRAMVGQLVPVFVGGKLMGFRRKKNDRLLMFILRHYGQDAQGRKTTINYFSTRATAGAAAGSSPGFPGEGDQAKPGGGALAAADASTTTLRTVISGPAAAPDRIAADDRAASLVNAFAGVDLDAEAQAEIYRALEACAERRRALEADPENDPERVFASPGEARGGIYLGELELGSERDWVEYKPDGEHHWESLGEGGSAAETDRVLAEMAERKALKSPEQQAAEAAAAREQISREIAAQQGPAKPVLSDVEGPEPDPDSLPRTGSGDPRLDWRDWTDEGHNPPSPRSGGGAEGEGELDFEPAHPEAILSDEPAPAKAGEGPKPAPAKAGEGPEPPVPNPRKRYKKRKPKPPFTPLSGDEGQYEARKAEAAEEVAAFRRENAAAEAARRKARVRRT